MKRSLFLLTFLGSLLTTVGCVVGSTGEQGNLIFYDETKVPEFMDTDKKLDAPVAENARIQIKVKNASTMNPAAITDVKIDPEILEVVGQQNAVVTLKAKSPGTANVEVTAGGLSDNIKIRVVKPTKQIIEPRPFYDLYLNPDVFAKGLAVLIGSKIWFFGWQIDDNGNKLTGFGADTWTRTGDDDSFDGKTLQNTDYLEITALKPGKTMLNFGNAGYELVAEQETDITDMKIYEALEFQKMGNDFQTWPGHGLLIYLAMYDAEGRMVTGALQKKPDFTTEETDVVQVTQPEDKKDTDDPDPKKVNYPYRFAFVDCKKESGDAVINVSWQDLETKFTVHCIKKPQEN